MEDFPSSTPAPERPRGRDQQAQTSHGECLRPRDERRVYGSAPFIVLRRDKSSYRPRYELNDREPPPTTFVSSPPACIRLLFECDDSRDAASSPQQEYKTPVKSQDRQRQRTSSPRQSRLQTAPLSSRESVVIRSAPRKRKSGSIESEFENAATRLTGFGGATPEGKAKRTAPAYQHHVNADRLHGSGERDFGQREVVGAEQVHPKLLKQAVAEAEARKRDQTQPLLVEDVYVMPTRTLFQRMATPEEQAGCDKLASIWIVKIMNFTQGYVKTIKPRKARDEVKNVAPELPEVLKEKIGVDFVLLRTFSEATDGLNGQKYPTLAMAVPVLRQIERKLKNNKCLMQFFVLLISALDPRCSEPKYLTQKEVVIAKSRLKSAVILLANEISGHNEETSGNTRPSFVVDPQSSATKEHIVWLTGVFSGGADEHEVEEVTVTNENLKDKCESQLTLFLNDSQGTVASVNPLNMWNKERRSNYPIVVVLARKWIGCIATSVPSERAFSHSGNIVASKRCSLDPEIICDIMFVGENYAEDDDDVPSEHDEGSYSEGNERIK
ncbi:hypothetical protein ON010_g9630 [Phytophthora cinnamomi]|nr:hypothetical protein ON010_g9630 [Phytophthora cinnamomi]